MGLPIDHWRVRTALSRTAFLSHCFPVSRVVPSTPTHFSTLTCFPTPSPPPLPPTPTTPHTRPHPTPQWRSHQLFRPGLDMVVARAPDHGWGIDWGRQSNLGRSCVARGIFGQQQHLYASIFLLSPGGEQQRLCFFHLSYLPLANGKHPAFSNCQWHHPHRRRHRYPRLRGQDQTSVAGIGEKQGCRLAVSDGGGIDAGQPLHRVFGHVLPLH